MHLLSLNVEGARHTTAVLELIDTKTPDIICLQEAPAPLATTLSERGFFVTFTPTIIRNQDGHTFEEGVLIASRTPHTAESFCYYQPDEQLHVFEKAHYRDTTRKVVILATCEEFKVATTHFTWTPSGETADEHQLRDHARLAAYLDTQPAHILCGDLNIPRFHNPLYDAFTTKYADAIPQTYTSSLDRTHHRCAQDLEKQHLFTDFMVDHLLTQSPYSAENVELIFGVSDHAAICATITKTK